MFALCVVLRLPLHNVVLLLLLKKNVGVLLYSSAMLCKGKEQNKCTKSNILIHYKQNCSMQD